MSEDKLEYTEGGQPVYRHKRTKEFSIPDSEDCSIDEITKHVEVYIGKVNNVYHELVSDLVHIDVLVVEPTKDRNFYTLVTSGMSDKPMNVPEGLDEYKYAELMMCLPATWKLTDKDLKDERNYWPIRWLKVLARFPHEYDTWLGFGHSMPNGDPAEPFAANTKLSGIVLAYPLTVNSIGKFYRLKVREDKIINFYAVYPVYEEEMQFKLDNDAESLLSKFDENQFNEIINVKRKNVCKKSFWPFK